MFEKARLKLTAIYLIIIMSISLFFSLIIYSSANQEFSRFEFRQKRIIREINENRHGIGPGNTILLDILDYDEIQKARIRFIGSLVFVNLLIFAASGVASYSLAGRTLEPIEKMLDEQKRFISDSSHELRTPLTSLRTETEIALRSKKLNLSLAKKTLNSNLEEIISLQILSDRLLQLSQNGQNLSKSTMEKVSIIKIIEKADAKTKKLADAKNIIIENKVEDASLNGIEDRLVEAFVILIDNAIKYSPNDSKVKLLSKNLRNKVEISIIDNGVGISKKDLPFVFDRFYRSDKARSEEGFGLGLSIAKKIVESHKGLITVKSIPSKKTEFVVSLPTKRA